MISVLLYFFLFQYSSLGIFNKFSTVALYDSQSLQVQLSIGYLRYYEFGRLDCMVPINDGYCGDFISQLGIDK